MYGKRPKGLFEFASRFEAAAREKHLSHGRRRTGTVSAGRRSRGPDRTEHSPHSPRFGHPDVSRVQPSPQAQADGVPPDRGMMHPRELPSCAYEIAAPRETVPSLLV